MTSHSTITNRADQLFPPAKIPYEPVGIGFRTPHYEEVLETDLNLGWLEVHPENYFGGGVHRHFLSEVRRKYQISLHAVGLSLGSDQPVSEDHLARVRELIDIYDPFSVSDHASWSASGNAHLNDLLPLPYTQASLNKLARNVERAQEALGRRMLIENPSTYLAFKGNEMHEDTFMNKLADMTGCGILLDLNNIYVQAHNHDYDAWSYVDMIEAHHVGEMHLAGHIEQTAGEGTLLVDTHSRPVKGDVWGLYEHAIKRIGVVPTLIEWDNDIPDLATLVSEAAKARAIIQKVRAEDLPDAAE
ncbi:MAG TPA: DUF692 domain-containing protein [Alphaproteobacteria bacterium]|nr:MAG: DUF692 domain-containing protein [Rhodospirillales bacterium]HOO80895.1 DUF692 domain-containing protein [Alphaproteobacteria bacterium]